MLGIGGQLAVFIHDDLIDHAAVHFARIVHDIIKRHNERLFALREHQLIHPCIGFPVPAGICDADGRVYQDKAIIIKRLKEVFKFIGSDTVFPVIIGIRLQCDFREGDEGMRKPMFHNACIFHKLDFLRLLYLLVFLKRAFQLLAIRHVGKALVKRSNALIIGCFICGIEAIRPLHRECNDFFHRRGIIFVFLRCSGKKGKGTIEIAVLHQLVRGDQNRGSRLGFPLLPIGNFLRAV